MNTNEIAQQVTDRIVAALKEDRIPWHRPWRVYGGIHQNFVSKRVYRGINQFLLDLTAQDKSYHQPYWLTMNQINKLGGKVRKGEKSQIVVFWKIIEKKDKKGDVIESFPLLRYYRVFNVEQTEGMEDKIPKIEESEFTPIERAQQIIDNMPQRPTLIHRGEQSSYNPELDTVTLPPQSRFDHPQAYYSTAYHELAHSTGHEDRLDRGLDSGFGTDPYAKEELVAEMAAAMLAGIAEIDIVPQQENTKAYIQSWIRRFEEQPRLVIQAASKGHKAADFILGNA